RSPGASALPAPRPAAAWTMTELPSSARPHALNATRTIRSHWLARFSRSEGAQNFLGKKRPFPLPRTAGGVFILEPFWERPAGPQHTPAERDHETTTPLRPAKVSTSSGF